MRRAVIVDGFISGAAMLIAQTLCPTTRDYMIASHRSAEKGHGIVLSHLNLLPLLDLDMRLGEGKRRGACDAHRRGGGGMPDGDGDLR